jgi:replication initiation and membrane attachment protein DnaB
VIAGRELEIKNDIFSYIDKLSIEEIEAITQLEKLRKGEISSSDLDMSKLNQIGNKLAFEVMNIANKYKKL